jgi:signal transduction histidine kinase
VPGSGRARDSVALQVGWFALAGLAALALVGLATLVASRRLGEREAVIDARAAAVVKAQGVVEPAVTDALLTGDPAARARLDDVVRLQVLDRSLVRIKLWDAGGRIVYSDEPRVIGAVYPLGAAEKGALRTGRIDAEVSNLARPENRFERQSGKLLEVYLPIQTPRGTPLLFEAYFRYNAVQASAARLWRGFAPIALGALVMLELVQLPLAWSLANRLRDRLRERERLLQRALEASEVERRQIASDLHDGVVQDLAGLGYALAAAARAEGDTADRTQLLEQSASTVRESIKALRSLLVEIYPPNLEEEGLAAALSDLLARASGRGVEAELDTAQLREPLPAPMAGLLYRATQEALRNVLSHAGARTMRVRVANEGDDAVLEVVDDGRGFEPARAAAQAADGHLGLRGLAGLVGDAGGELHVESSPGTGTTFRVTVPVA